MKILVLNCGSSSLKYQLINPKSEEVFAIGNCERIGLNDSSMSYKAPIRGVEIAKKHSMPTHKEALELLISTLTDSEVGVINSTDEIEAIGHRVVHGGEEFNGSVYINDDVIDALVRNSELAPLHNPANLIGIRTCKKIMPEKPNVGVFDTAFHSTLPPKAFMYALPYEDYSELKVRKYGFHGTSHKFVSGIGNEILGNPSNSKIIVCHLGNGASISAVKNGTSIETSMGLTPLQGLMMGTRSGDMDPAAVLYIMDKRGLSAKEMDTRMNKKSGVLGIYGKSSDFRDLEDSVDEGDEKAKLALEMFCYRVRSYIGSYATSMGGVDMICFTGGIGENSSTVRKMILENLEFMGVCLNEDVNNVRQKGIVELSSESSKVKVYKIPTNEELVIARDTLDIISKMK